MGIRKRGGQFVPRGILKESATLGPKTCAACPVDLIITPDQQSFGQELFMDRPAACHNGGVRSLQPCLERLPKVQLATNCSSSGLSRVENASSQVQKRCRAFM